MASTSNLRRSSRPKKPPNYAYVSTYPDSEPSTPVERWVAKLDKQAFPSQDYARVDDILVYALFANKKKPDSDRALRPTRAFLESDPPIGNSDAMEICKAYLQVAESSNDSLTVSTEVGTAIIRRFPDLFPGKWDEKILKHLLQRYHIMNYSGPKAIRIEKVRYHQGSITCGLKAATDLEPSVVILASCSSMSSDLVLDRPGVSIIKSSSTQIGPLGPRLILGPFRFANHDCSPNCQITAIPKTNAYALCTIRKIAEGEPITVKYTKDGSYFKEGGCGCATCMPDSPPVAQKRPFDPLEFLPNPNPQKKKRGGKRSKRKLPKGPLELLGPRAINKLAAPLPRLYTLPGQAPLPYL